MNKFQSRSCLGIALAVFALASAPAPRAVAEDIILASTFNFTTINGTVQANGNISGKPIAATTFFDPGLLDLPLSDPDDPLGTARHELFHGIGFGSVYNSFFSHIFTKTSGPLIGLKVFNELTNGLGNDMAVMTANGSHIETANFDGLGNGGTLINQTYLLMTIGPIPGAPVPYAIDSVSRGMLNAAFNWAGTGGIKINVVFDNSQGPWTAFEKARVNLARDNVQAAFGAPDGTNIFTWTVLVPEPSSMAMMVVATLGLLASCFRKKRGSANHR